MKIPKRKKINGYEKFGILLDKYVKQKELFDNTGLEKTRFNAKTFLLDNLVE